jgi:hypothetical protein
METMTNEQFFSLLKDTVEKHGCRIVDIDLKNHNINLDGPDEAVEACSIALANLFS